MGGGGFARTCWHKFPTRRSFVLAQYLNNPPKPYFNCSGPHVMFFVVLEQIPARLFLVFQVPSAGLARREHEEPDGGWPNVNVSLP